MQNLQLSANSRQHRISVIFLLNIFIGVTVFYFMGAKHINIGFHADDYGFLYNGAFRSIKGIKRIFSNGDMIDNANVILNQEAVPKKASFTEALYRPLLLLVMGSEQALFGLNTYKFHLVHTALHTCITLALFNIVSILFSPVVALPIALFFGFHSSLKDYFFWQCYIQNTLEALFLCFIIFFFILWRKHQNGFALACSLSLFFTTLLLRETLLILPALTALWAFIEPEKTGLAQRLKKALKSFFLFSLPVCGYFLIRLWAHPFSKSTTKIGIKHFNTDSKALAYVIKGKFFDLLTWFIDLIGLKWIPANNGCIKFIALALLTIFICFLWRKNPYKKILFILAAGCLLFSWPSILLVHCSRYLYLPTLFFALFIGILASTLSRKYLYFFIIIGLNYALLQSFITTKWLTLWVKQTAIETICIQNLASHLTKAEHTIIIGHPARLIGTGTAAALTFYGINPQTPGTFTLPSYAAWERGPIGTLFYTRINNTISITSTTPNTLWIPLQAVDPFTKVYNCIIHEQKDNKITSLSLTINQEQLDNSQVIGWNFSKTCFERL